MIRYKVTLNERTRRIANIDFPHWSDYNEAEIKAVLRMILKDLNIDLKFYVTKNEINSDPSSRYSLILLPDRIEINEDIPNLLITKDDNCISNIDITQYE